MSSSAEEEAKQLLKTWIIRDESLSLLFDIEGSVVFGSELPFKAELSEEAGTLRLVAEGVRFVFPVTSSRWQIGLKRATPPEPHSVEIVFPRARVSISKFNR